MATRTGPYPGFVAVLAVVAGMLTFVLRYNTPEGAFGGLTDDHFFFATQAWQMLFGEWPDRDYFEPGAPLTLGISAALQATLGRSVWSEYVFCVTALAVGAAGTVALATQASRSLVLGALAGLFQFALLTRLYGYPKVVVYVAAIGAMWAWANAPGTRRTLLVAAVAATAFLLRHDHGVYVGVTFAVLLLAISGVPLVDRARQAGIFAAGLAAMLAPYLLYLQLNGGIVRHFVSTYAWAARDYLRAPRVLPELGWRPLLGPVDTDAPPSEWWEHAPFAQLFDLSTFWLFWLFLLLPLLAAVLLAVRPAGSRHRWPQETAKVLVVIAFACLVDYGFLRGNLAGRLADVSVPLVILSAWVLARATALSRGEPFEVLGRAGRFPLAVRVPLGVLTAGAVLVTGLVLVRPFMAALENGRLLQGVEAMRGGMETVTERVQHTWPLDAWADPNRAELALARYLQVCTAPDDRVLVTDFRSPILGLAQRGFAAGHVDMRGGGFFGSVAEQELSVERWRRQSVPVVIGPTLEDYPDWEESLPIVARYLNAEYHNRGELEIGGFRFLLFERRDQRVVRAYGPLGLPCFR